MKSALLLCLDQKSSGKDGDKHNNSRDNINDRMLLDEHSGKNDKNDKDIA